MWIVCLQNVVSTTAWKKAIDRFTKHEKSGSYCHVVSMVISASKECMDVGSKLSKENEEKRALNRKCLLAIITTILFLARQGLMAMEKLIAYAASFPQKKRNT